MSNFDPKEWTKQLIDFLINVVPVHETPDSAPNEIAAQEHYYDGANIAAGKEDLASYVVDLFGALDAIRDDEERHRAYVALYRVIYGTYLIAKSGTYPLGVELYSHDAQARVTRWAKERELARRNAIVLAVVAEYEKKTDKRPKAKFLIDPINERLAEAYSGIKKPPTISVGVLYSILRKRRECQN